MKFKFPTPYTVLIIVIILSAILTFILPSGSYDRLSYDKSTNEFTIKGQDSSKRVAATQEVLEGLNIHISLDKFKKGKIKKPISIPGTYKKLDPNRQGVSAVIFAPIKGIYDAIQIILFVLVLGGFIGVFNSSGALNQGVGFLAHRLKGREGILIVLVVTLVALGGTSFGLAEETLAFYPILIPVFLAAGYDLLVPVAVIFTASCVGTMASTVNPFATIIASDAAGVDWTMGIVSRAIMLVIGTVVSMIYIMRYAKRIKADPTKSLVYGTKLPSSIDVERAKPINSISSRTKLLLSIFGFTFIVMIYGVSRLEWWFQEMTALFLISSIIISVLQRTGEQRFISDFIGGAKDLLGVAFIIGIARGVTFIMNEGQISDTILYYATGMVEGVHPFFFLPMLMFVFAILTLFISSSSGMAVVTMPIMGSLGTVVGVETHQIVDTYLFGMGLMSFITPSGMILPSLAMVNVSFNKWLKFIIPLLLILTVIAICVLWGGLYL